MMENKHTLEYSTVQKCYHIDTVENMLKNNLVAVERGICNGYLLIGVFDTYEEAEAFKQLHILYSKKADYFVNQNGELT